MWTLLFSSISCSLSSKGGNESKIESERANRTQEASKILKDYFVLEQSQEYGKIYELLTPNFKAGLLKESGVRNAEDYEQLRKSSEAKWSQFSIKSEQIESNERVLFIVNAQIEEAGENEKIIAKYSLVLGEGRWLVDSWQY
jgi:hypothetical protein